MKKQNFNMIEVTLAIAVIAIGMVSIMGLFPIGLSANKDAMAKSYAAEAADEFLHYLEREIRNDWASYITEASPYIPTTKPSTTDFNIVTYNANQTVYGSGTDGVYKSIRFVDKNNNQIYNDGTDIMDFDAIILAWQEDIDILGAGNRNVGVKLVMEISWPAKVPYANRSKDEYVLELFNR
jgi:hypothetical protein